jgi:hypothetical protein
MENDSLEEARAIVSAVWAGPSYLDDDWETELYGDANLLKLPPEVVAVRTGAREFTERALMPEWAAEYWQALDGIVALLAMEAAIAGEVALLLAELRALGAPWQGIGDILGMSKQRLHKRYAPTVNKITSICKTEPRGAAQAALLGEEIYKGWTY